MSDTIELDFKSKPVFKLLKRDLLNWFETYQAQNSLCDEYCYPPENFELLEGEIHKWRFDLYVDMIDWKAGEYKILRQFILKNFVIKRML